MASGGQQVAQAEQPECSGDNGRADGGQHPPLVLAGVLLPLEQIIVDGHGIGDAPLQNAIFQRRGGLCGDALGRQVDIVLIVGDVGVVQVRVSAGTGTGNRHIRPSCRVCHRPIPLYRLRRQVLFLHRDIGGIGVGRVEGIISALHGAG